MMKKYLMTGIAAIAIVAGFTSCSHDFEPMTEGEIAQAKYDQAFLKYIGGSIDKNQDWGFSATAYSAARTRANSGENYPATSTGINANANEWADPNKEFGGWLVPDALTEGQKERVRAYFQANPNLTFTDPEWRHFFVQQVYKGGSAQAGVSSESITAVDGNTYTSTNMNELSVGQNNQHINNFNGGSYGATGTNSNEDGTVNVLNNGQTVGGTTHPDQIMLMVNIDDTSCFGYKDSATGGTQHNNKAALVSAATIDAWAASNGNPGSAVTDKWNRSFLGFDLALLEGEQVYAKNGNSIAYADYSQAPGQPVYAWDGENIIAMKEIASTDQWGNITWGDWKDEYKYIMNGTNAVGWLDTNSNFYVDGGTINLNQTSNSLNAATISSQNWNDIKNYVVFEDAYVEGAQNNKAKVLNLKRIKELLTEGYLPVNNKSLTKWVKVGKSDGYFTDWIVTLTEAQRIPDEVYDLKIIAEDLSAGEDGDFDFNDIVLEVKYGSPAKVKLTHAGGTLPLCINMNENWETHKLFGVGEKTMVNTGAGPTKAPVVIEDFNESIADAAEANTKIRLYVKKGESWQEMKAPKGEPASKLAVGIDFKVLGERTSIKESYPLFVDWANDKPFTSKWWTTEE